MQERGFNINHTTIYRWGIEYTPKLNRDLRKHLKQTGDFGDLMKPILRLTENGCTYIVY